MPRRKIVKRREIPPDAIYNSQLVSKLVNNMMMKGKKSLSERICYAALDIVHEKTKEPPLKVLNRAVDNVRPRLMVKSRRVGGATYQVPLEVPKMKGTATAIKWIISFARTQKGKPMEEKLAREVLDAANKTGSAIKKRIDTHKMAEANRAFAHYRW